MKMSKANQDRVARGEVPMGIVNVAIRFSYSGDQHKLHEDLGALRKALEGDPEVSEMTVVINNQPVPATITDKRGGA